MDAQDWVKILVAICGAGSSLFLTIRYYLRGKMTLDRERRVWIHQALKSFKESVDRIESVQTRHEQAIENQTKEATALNQALTAVQTQVKYLANLAPRLLDLMEKVDQHFRRKQEDKSAPLEDIAAVKAKKGNQG